MYKILNKTVQPFSYNKLLSCIIPFFFLKQLVLLIDWCIKSHLRLLTPMYTFPKHRTLSTILMLGIEKSLGLLQNWMSSPFQYLCFVLFFQVMTQFASLDYQWRRKGDQKSFLLSKQRMIKLEAAGWSINWLPMLSTKLDATSTVTW